MNNTYTQPLPQDAVCRVAMIGAGNMAREHLKAFADIRQVRFAGITSRTRSRAEALAQEFGIQMVVDNVAELADLKPHLVIITVNAEHVHEVVKECCGYPFAILAEKPVGMSLQQYMETMSVVRRSGAMVFIALNRRLHASTRYLLTELEQCSGPRFIEVFDQQEPERLRQLGRHIVDQELAFSNGIHAIDFLPFLGRGDIAAVTPVLPWIGPETLAVAAAVNFTSGDMGMYHAVWNAPGPWAVFVTTHEKRFELRPLEKLAIQPMGQRVLKEIALGDLDIRFKPGLRIQAEEAVKAALGLGSRCTALAEARATMELINAVYAQ